MSLGAEPRRSTETSETLRDAAHDSVSTTTPSSTSPLPNTTSTQLTGAVSPKALEAGEKGPVDDEDSVLIVDWDGPDDPANPKNWPFKSKWAATAIVSAFTFISPVSSSMIAPAAAQVAEQFGIKSEVEIAMTTSVFVLAYAVGPLFLGPMSELYGRSHVLQLANLFYLVWNIACGFAQSSSQLIAFRFLAGLGGSAPLAIGGGVLGDLWAAHERGQAIALYSLAPLLGPVVGPVAGAWIAQSGADGGGGSGSLRGMWRWVFWSTSIVCGIVQILGVFYLRETFAPVLLERKANLIKNKMGIPEEDQHRVRTVYQSDERHWKRIFAKSLIRPFALFAREPIIQLLGVYMAFIYGLIYLLLTTLPAIFQSPETYGFRPGIAGLHYIALGVGLTGASQANARLLDKVYVYLTAKNGGVGKPEFRLPTMVPGTIFLPVGLLMAGWSAQKVAPWIVCDIGIAFIGAGMILNFQGIQTYVIDAFTLHAASALASVSCLRSLAGFGFPLFAPAMYNALGYGKGDTILACFAIALGCPAPWLFWHFGERIRKSSRYAVDA
ncbi:MFS polyamine transporter [Rickenella mellea]|uniref:MFS polyamine transporter n=1 Tax=Rickenella mellea TaxID=50990 RepID=A0A4Y7PNJ6_9AGAM|nr:MFS polyamine transporter [Rickenella mellea]